MSIPPKKRISRKIDNTHIVWFQESNYWTQLEEPAWFIYKKFNSGSVAADITQKFSVRYSLNIDKSQIFVKNILKEIRKLSSSTYSAPQCFSANQFESPSHYFSIRTYRVNQKIIEVSFGSSLLEYIIHPSFAHIEIEKNTKPHYKLDAFSSASSSILKIAGKAWSEDDANLLKRRLYIELAGLLYGKSDEEWLSFIHASAVSNNRESIILSTSCGSGKSTLAGLLCQQGLKFVSDDFVAIDARFCKVYPFPAALSVKDGAYTVLHPLYEQLKTNKVFHFKGTNKTVRYLPFPADRNFYKPLPVRNLVFVKYDSSKAFSFRKVPVLEAIRRFNEEAWVSSSPAHARKFIKWFPGLNCYELEYSDNEQAIREIKGLFKDS